MISYSEAISLISGRFKNNSNCISLEVPIELALNKYLSEDIVAPINVPSFDNSAMDGYAVNWQFGGTKIFKIQGNIQAGDGILPKIELSETYRIFTGAPIPPGCNTIIQKEWVTEHDGNMIVNPNQEVALDLHIKKTGSQTKKGEKFLSKGTFIGPETIGLMASLGLTNCSIYASPKIGILNTGNELRTPGEALKLGEIYNSNGYTLRALCENAQLPFTLFPSCKDDLEIIQEAISKAMRFSDITLITGGISVGDFDFVKTALTNLGVETVFYKVKQKPGKPLFIGTKGAKWVVALPGNPAAVISCFHVYVKAIINHYFGKDFITQSHKGVVVNKEGFSKKAGLTHFLKAHIFNGEVRLLFGQESFNLSAFSHANCLAIIPEDTEKINSGDMVNIIPF